MTDTLNTLPDIDTLPPPSLEQLERQLTALLYAIWRAQGKDKEVIDWDNRRETNKRGLTPNGRK